MTKWEAEKSRAAYRLLREEHAVGEGIWITYSEIGSILGVTAQGMGRVLRVVQDHCLRRGLPTITVFVVRKETGFPGGGCDVVMPDEVRATAKKVCGIQWPAQPWW